MHPFASKLPYPVGILLSLAILGGSVSAADVTINSIRQFAALDASDGAADG